MPRLTGKLTWHLCEITEGPPPLYKDNNDHIMKHLQMTKKPSDLYEGCDEDGNGIADNNENEQYSWSNATV